MSKILVTDDSLFMRRVIVDSLKKAGYEDVLEASSGEEALKTLESEKVDLVLLDVIMPDMNGIDVLKKIGNKQKVIIVTAVGQEEIIAQAKELGAVGYITKPFTAETALSEIKKVIES